MPRASGTCALCGYGRDLLWDWRLMADVFAFDLFCLDARACGGRLTARRLIASAVGE